MGTRLSRQLSAVTGWMLPKWSAGPTEPHDLFTAAVAAGYEGVQVFLPDQAKEAREAGLGETSGIGPARSVEEAEAMVGMWAGGGASSLTLHLGTGFESRDQAHALVEATLASAGRHGVPLLVETHRATLFQDPARTLELVDAFPELRFTADLSHWYTGVEMVYGDLEAKLSALAPVFARCRMIHGRISDPGCIQVAVGGVDDDSTYVEHFKQMWTLILQACDAEGVDELPFVVELLPAGSFYARTVDGGDRGDGPQEEVDRWTQADVLWEIAAGLTP
ncbi:MAG TPA: hypothetical protein VGA13_10585 [Acidimicrobiales bacterium]